MAGYAPEPDISARESGLFFVGSDKVFRFVRILECMMFLL
jgi:hypothetical protein